MVRLLWRASLVPAVLLAGYLAVVATQILTLIFMAVLFGGLFLSRELIFVGAEAAGIIAIVLLPVLAYVFFLLARRGIDKDIALVRSMDRLR